MNITFVAPFGLGQKTTMWARTLPLARHLAGRGCRVSILIPPWDTPADAGKRWIDKAVEVINVELRGGLPWITARLLAQIRAIQPDIVHIVKPRAYAGIVQWILWQRRRLGGSAPRIFLDVDDWEQSWSAIGGYAPWTARFLDWQENWGITHADAVTAASRWLEGTVQRMAPGTPVLYLPNGVTPPDTVAAQDRSAPNPTPTVLLFSRFVEVDPDWMGECWRALRQLAPRVELLVAGQALQPHGEDAFRTALAGDRVRWLGYIDPQKISALYADIDCAIFPAADRPLNQAKCSVRLASTLLRGVPVVASAVGEQAHYGADGAARLVPADAKPDQFAAAVADLLAAPMDQRTLAEKARHRLLTEYDWSRLGDQLVGFYEQLESLGPFPEC
ncbi:MAG: glycosyltransferase family 4 protein [Caldilineaceae bacterium]|nr:glycosyltransferase family 4 protein [Caldilineaceae bacterium]